MEGSLLIADCGLRIGDWGLFVNVNVKVPSVAPSLADSGGAMEGSWRVDAKAKSEKRKAEREKNEGLSGLGISDEGKLQGFQLPFMTKG
jgi:hypothetical protein